MISLPSLIVLCEFESLWNKSSPFVGRIVIDQEFHTCFVNRIPPPNSCIRFLYLEVIKSITDKEKCADFMCLCLYKQHDTQFVHFVQSEIIDLLRIWFKRCCCSAGNLEWRTPINWNEPHRKWCVWRFKIHSLYTARFVSTLLRLHTIRIHRSDQHFLFCETLRRSRICYSR